jgi:superfamily I DNA and RNA helicase
MLEVVYGQTRKQTIANRVVAALQPLGLDGTVFIGYPVLASADEPISIDALLVCKEHGLVAFVFEPDAPPSADAAAWQKFQGEQDRVFFALTTSLARHALRKGRELAFAVNVVTLFPALVGAPDLSNFQVTDISKLPDELRKFVPLPTGYEKPLNAALQRVSTLRPPKKRASVTTPNSRGGILRKLEEEIANLDRWQKAATIESPEGPQRIRGIAGSGKTVVLALRRPLIFMRSSLIGISLSPFTPGPYDQFQDLIRRFTFEQTSDEPDWSKLRVMHAWGGADREGVYTDLASASGVNPRDFLYGKTKFGSKGAFAGVRKELLAALAQREIEPLYDVVLIDEAQDLPEAFFFSSDLPLYASAEADHLGLRRTPKFIRHVDAPAGGSVWQRRLRTAACATVEREWLCKTRRHPSGLLSEYSLGTDTRS